MKIAVLSDVHAHWVALQAVADHLERWQPDYVIVGGDHINRGPRPVECLQFLTRKAAEAGWLLVRGNHDEYVISHAGEGRPTTQPDWDFFQATIWTSERIDNDAAALEALPFQVSLTSPSGGEVRAVHASMLGTRQGLFPHTSDAEIREKMSPPPEVLCVGHTHHPFARQVDGTLVVNVGSAGLPFDGDARAGYAQLTWRNGAWQADIVRIPYDYEAAQQDFYETGYLAEGGPLVALVLDELQRARSNLAQWAAVYEQPVLTGDISMQESVTNYLNTLRSDPQ